MIVGHRLPQVECRTSLRRLDVAQRGGKEQLFWNMAQVTLYLPADVLEAARKRADQENRSLSAWVNTLIRQATTTEWPECLVKLLHHGNGDLVEPADPPPKDVDAFR